MKRKRKKKKKYFLYVVKLLLILAILTVAGIVGGKFWVHYRQNHTTMDNMKVDEKEKKNVNGKEQEELELKKEKEQEKNGTEREEGQEKNDTEGEEEQEKNGTEREEGQEKNDAENEEKQEKNGTESEEDQKGKVKENKEAAVKNHDSSNSVGLVVIDPGHQRVGNSEKEPIGPGATETKAKVTGGTSGVSTGKKEYELALEVSFKLRSELEKRSYKVIMTRESHDVNISNSERAAVANDANADVFIRIHANGSENHNVSGAMTICQTQSNPYNSDLYEKSHQLAVDILDCFTAKTGAVREKVWETDTMSGINWATVPCTILEMGYMTNPSEDEKMSTEAYQELMVQGIADGIDRFMRGDRDEE